MSGAKVDHMGKEQIVRQPGDPPERMAKLYLGLLWKGPQWSAEVDDKVKADQRGHLANFERLRESGMLLIAGPVPEGDPLRGILVCQAASPEAVEAEFESDPHLRSGRLILEILPWLVDADLLERPLVDTAKYILD